MKKTNSLIARLVTLVLMICLVFSLAIVVSTAAEETATLSFADKANRTDFSTTKQVWSQNGITFTNNKGSSTNAVADYAKPVRLYANSEITIEAPGNITKIVFDANTTGYATALKNSIGSTATASSDKVTVEPGGSSNTYTVAKLSAQVRLDSITVTYAAAEPEPPAPEACSHVWNETTTDPTCTTDGKLTKTCTLCDETTVETIPATGHVETIANVTKEPGYGTTGIEIVSCKKCGAKISENTLPALWNATFSAPGDITTPTNVENQSQIVLGGISGSFYGYEFVGWSTTTVDPDGETPKIYAVGDTYSLVADVNFYAVFRREIESGSDSYTLVKDVNDLKLGSNVIIAAANYNKAFLAQTNNNWSAIDITKGDDGNVLSTYEGAMVFMLEEGNKNGTFAFSYKDGYIYAASSGSNHLKTQQTLSDNSSWSITIAANGVATIKAQGTYTRNWIRYNATSNLFSAYSNGQTDVVIYMQGSSSVEYTTSPIACKHDSGTTTNVIDPTCTESGSVQQLCSKCGTVVSEEFKPQLGHNMIASEIITSATCSSAGKRSYYCDRCDHTETRVILPNEHTLGEENICSVCNLKIVGRYYIAAMRGGSCWFMTSNVSDNRYQTANSNMSFSPYEVLIGDADPSCVFTVIEKNGSFYIYADGIISDEKYLSWTEGNTGSFSTFEEAQALTLNFDSDGNVKIAVAANENRILASNGNYWAFYEGSGTNSLTLVPVVAEATEPKLESVRLKLGTDIAFLFTAIYTGDKTLSFRVVFNNTEYIITEENIDKSNYRYTFTFEDIGPHQMGKEIFVYLRVDGNEVDELENYTINDNLNNVIANYPGAVALAEAALAYGKAAAAYQSNQEAEDLDLSDIEIDPSLIQSPSKPTDLNVARFTFAGVYFDVTNRIYIKFIAAEGCTVTVNGKEIDLTTLECVDGTYKYYTDEITAVEFGKNFKFVINYTQTVDGEEKTTKITELTYSVNAYAAAMQNSTDNFTANLVKALYLYGQKALEYKTLSGGNN